MIIKIHKISFVIVVSLIFSFEVSTQDLSPEFLASLPEDVQAEILSTAQQKQDLEAPQYRRPSTFIQKPEPTSSRFGENYFSMMQSTLMPINEPNLDPDYILGFGDVIQLQLVGQKSEITELPILRDGSVNLPDIGKIFLSGISLEQATKIIKSRFESSFVGVDVFITLLNIRDIQVLVSGNAYNPGPYVLNGNSNLFHALSVSGGPSELGSFRKIDLIRNNIVLDSIDLYENFLYGKNSFGPKLRSGDTIFIHPAKNQISISGAIKRPGNYELKQDESIDTLINFANGLRTDADLDFVFLERIKDGKVFQLNISPEEFEAQLLNDGEQVYIRAFPLRNVTISGAVQNPGSYKISEGEGVLELVNRAGGYTKNAYEFGGILLNQEAAQIAEDAKNKLYQDFISSFLETATLSGSNSSDSIAIFMNEIRDTNPSGRIFAEFKIDTLITDPSLNTRLMEGDEIIIPEIVDHIYIFGEVSNQGTSKFTPDKSIEDYISSLGGFSEFADTSSIFVVHPNGMTQSLQRKNVFRDGRGDSVEIYPGSIIFVPREIPNAFRAEILQGYTSILGNLGVTLASISILKD